MVIRIPLKEFINAAFKSAANPNCICFLLLVKPQKVSYHLLGVSHVLGTVVEAAHILQFPPKPYDELEIIIPI